jgi:hypothetical protein
VGVDDNWTGELSPHDGVELDLMLAGTKPLAMFLQDGFGAPGGEPYEDLDDIYEAFRPHVERGAIIRREVLEGLPSYGSGSPRLLRRALFARAGETWRIDAMLAALSALSHPSEAHFREEIERYIGYLLGYTRGEVDTFSGSDRGRQSRLRQDARGVPADDALGAAATCRLRASVAQ